jgi:uncharacterized phage-associated protein
MAPATANLVAECIISLSHEKHAPISNLKLQKLLYYSQAWHLALFKHPLFKEEIEAWVHGPVVPEIFRRYRDCKWSPIPDSKLNSVCQFRPHLEEVWRVYGNFTAFELERLTHSEDPWKNARIGIASDASSHNIISKSSMRDYYAARLNGKA